MTLSPAEDEEEQDPTIQLWLYYFMAQHNLFQRKVDPALEFINKAIAHTPTHLDLYTLKGKIYQCGGDRQKAAVLHEEARNLDKADRAINAIAALYFLKDGQTEKGIATMDIFVRDCGYDVNVHDNQTMWFEHTTGRSYYANGDYRNALKQFWYVTSHANHMGQDLYDYYPYSMRRFTLQAFEDMLTFADTTLWQNRTIARAAISLIRLEHRVNKVKEEELTKFEPVMKEWQESDDYKELQKKLAEAEDEDEYKHDKDPKGFLMYKDMVS